MTRYTQAYLNEMTAFIDSVTNGTPAAPTGDDGLRALILAEAAVRSVAERRCRRNERDLRERTISRRPSLSARPVTRS